MANYLRDAIRYQQEMEEANRPATVNSLMARKAAAIKQNAPAENMLTQYAQTMPQNWQQFVQNLAQAYPTPATGASREQILGAVTQATINAGPGIMAGVGAKTANLAKLDDAKKMQARGIADEQIWRETGWTGGFPDKQWRFEIPDNTAVLREGNIPQRLGPLEIATQYLHDNGIRKTLDIGSPDTLVPRQLKQEAMQYAQMKMRNTPVPSAPINSVLQHEELFAAYPEFRQYPFSRELGGSYTGTFDPVSKNITAGGGLIGGGESAIKSTTLHELQHAVQERQGFARGGSPSGMSLEYNNARARLNFLEKDPDYITGMKKLDDLFVRAFDKGTLSSAQAIQLENQILAAHPALSESRKVMGILRQGNEYGSAYKKLAGEAEARLTQARMNMTPQQRAESYPPSMFDVPVEMQIVRK